MRTNFGIYRAIEPKGYTPISAMKLDNNKVLKEGEMRIQLKYIHLEKENFVQIARKCGYEEDKIKQRIINIVNRRGKLHNPITGTAGVCLGTIEEIYEGFQTNNKVGDKVYTISSLSGIPLMIEDIKKIDMNFGIIECKGYAIIFESTSIYKCNEQVDEKYLLAAIDQSGDLYENCRLCVKMNAKNVLIIGQNEISTLLYGESVRDAIGTKGHITSIMCGDRDSIINEDELNVLFNPIIKDSLVLNMNNPYEAYCKIRDISGNVKYDYIIVDNDENGVDSLASLLIKDGGTIYLQALNDRYNLAVLSAENMGKKINVRMFKQADHKNARFVEHIVMNLTYKLDEITKLYNRKKKEIIINKNSGGMKLDEERLDGFVYSSLVTKAMLMNVLNIAKFDCNVIIEGETGVGKERILSIIQKNSERSNKPCIKINCATIQENLAESEFFGYEGGAFTGAQSSGKKGYFELADGGILFLDEIGSLSLNMQSKLLRVLQENQFFRVGGVKQISVDVRVVCANNISLKCLVDQKLFREDLFYRLNICKIDVPPLRNRREDILSLASSFLNTLVERYNIDKEFSNEATLLLYNYDWPGNVRELENMVHRIFINSQDAVIDGAEVEELLYETMSGEKPLLVDRSFKCMEEMNFHTIMEKQEREVIEYALKKGGTTRKAAELLDLPQTTLARKKLKHGL